MAATDTRLLQQMDDLILDGKFREATDAYCRLVAAAPGDAGPITTHVMATAAPYLHVPAHHKLLPNGEFRNVNYDHTILGVRAGMRLMPWLSEREKYLTLAQAVWYVPQGLDVWAQLECGFPGHYAREQEKCAEEVLQSNKALHRHFEDQAPLREGTVDERFQRMFHAIVDGDKVTAYRLFLGLAAQPELRERVRNELLFAAIIDQQEFNSFRRVRHIGHKAIRTRSMLDIADWVGWEEAHPYFYIGVPDLCNAPIFHSLYDHASFMLGITFKGAQYRLHETNTAPLTEDEQDQLIAQIISGDPIAVTHGITALLRQGRALTAIADMVMIAHATHCVERLRTPIAYTVPMHAFDYANVVNFWLRNFKHTHQPKALYLSAWFVTDTIREVDWYPDDPTVARPEYGALRDWADGVPMSGVLAELERAVAAQDPSRAVALVRSYEQRTGERDALIRMLVHCAAKFQGDAHIFRNARSIIEEYYLNSASPRRKDVLFQAWAHYLSFYKKRTLSTECYDLYHDHFHVLRVVAPTRPQEQCPVSRGPLTRAPGGSHAAPWAPRPGVRRDLIWTTETSLLRRHRQPPQPQRYPVGSGGNPSIEPPWLRFTAQKETPRLISLTPTGCQPTRRTAMKRPHHFHGSIDPAPSGRGDETFAVAGSARGVSHQAEGIVVRGTATQRRLWCCRRAIGGYSGRRDRPRPDILSSVMVEIRLSRHLEESARAARTPMTVDELLARFPEVPRDLRDEPMLAEYVKAFGPLLRVAQKPSPCVGTGGDAQHVFYTRLVNDLAIYAIGLAKRDRTLMRLQATLDQYRRQPATFACTLVPRRAPGAPRVGCG